MGKHLRRFQGTHGKHVGDGLVYYFLPWPEGNYLSNAIQCAISMRSTMREISDEWSNRKGWLNGLKLNIGLDEGEEWFGSYQTPTQIEISALGDTINRTSRLSDFARDGTIWVTKNMISKLPEEDRCKVSFRIHHQSENEEAFVAHSYARISNLVNLSNPENKKLSDIATLAVTKII